MSTDESFMITRSTTSYVKERVDELGSKFVFLDRFCTLISNYQQRLLE